MNNEVKKTNPEVKARVDWSNPNQTDILKGIATVTIADAFQVHGVRIIKGKTGLFTSMPSRAVTDSKTGEKKYLETCHPVNNDMRLAISEAVISAYEQSLKSSESEAPAQAEPSVPEAERSFTDEPADDETEDEDPAPVMGIA